MKWFLVAFSVFALSYAHAVEQPEVIETYGDSVTAGFMSSTNVLVQPEVTELSSIWTNLATFVANGDKKAFAKLHSPDLSWAMQLKKLWGAATLENHAVSRARAKHLLEQLAGSKSHPGEKIASFFFMGHNDLCHSQESVDDFTKTFRTEYEAAIAEWDARHEGATLFLLPVGDIARVYRLLDGHTWFKNSHMEISCTNSWERTFPFCRENIKRRREGTLFDHLIPRTKNIRVVMEELAKDWNVRSKRGNRFEFLSDVLQSEYRKEFFAIDCYHLSKLGQEALAKDIFRAVQER